MFDCKLSPSSTTRRWRFVGRTPVTLDAEKEPGNVDLLVLTLVHQPNGS
jgi:hypothetical protein